MKTAKMRFDFAFVHFFLQIVFVVVVVNDVVVVVGVVVVVVVNVVVVVVGKIFLKVRSRNGEFSKLT